MTEKAHEHLSRRERQIMDIIHRLGKATAGEVLEALPDPPSYSAVRALLRLMEEKGHLRHETDGAKYVSCRRWRAKKRGNRRSSEWCKPFSTVRPNWRSQLCCRKPSSNGTNWIGSRR